MSLYRWDIEAGAGPATERVIGGSILLVRVRMYDDVEHPQPDAICDLRPADARDFAFLVLAAAEYAERLTDQHSARRDRRTTPNHNRHDQPQP